MSVQNLATVFGPNMLRPKMEDPVAIMEGVRHLLVSVTDSHCDQQLHNISPCLKCHTLLSNDTSPVVLTHIEPQGTS